MGMRGGSKSGSASSFCLQHPQNSWTLFPLRSITPFGTEWLCLGGLEGVFPGGDLTKGCGPWGVYGHPAEMFVTCFQVVICNLPQWRGLKTCEILTLSIFIQSLSLGPHFICLPTVQSDSHLSIQSAKLNSHLTEFVLSILF
jgi:hypothetical protein